MLHAARAREDFSRVPVVQSGRAQAPAITADRSSSEGALHVSDPSDPSEREARRVTEQLFGSPTPSRSALNGRELSINSLSPSQAARKETRSAASAPRTAAPDLPGGIADRGRTLPAGARTEMESAFGADLSSVRIHTGSNAAQLSRGLNADAVTYGNDIFFAPGRYDPVSIAGRRLLAHELTHTIQQRNAAPTLARQGGGRTTAQCVNENLSSAGVAAWLLAIVGTTCGLIFGIAGSPTGPGAAGTAAFGAAVCIAGVIGSSVAFVLGIISGCWSDPNHRSVGAYLSSAASSPGSAPAAQPGTSAAGGGEAAA
jgi:hypothetical protein